MTAYENDRGTAEPIFEGSGIPQLVHVSEVSFNVSQDVIITTEDKVRLCLERHAKHLECRSRWVAPLGISFTLLATLLTCNFKDWVFKSETWQAFFLMGFVLSVIWLVCSVCSALKAKGIDDIVTVIKKGASGKNATLAETRAPDPAAKPSEKVTIRTS